MEKIKKLFAILVVLGLFSCGQRGEVENNDADITDHEIETEILERRATDAIDEPAKDERGLRQEVTPAPRREAVDPKNDKQDPDLQLRDKKDPDLQLQKKEEQKLELQRPD